MRLFAPKYPSLVILAASAYHLLWGGILLAGFHPMFTANAGLAEIFPDHYVRGVFLVSVAASALWGNYCLNPIQATSRFMSAVPQQFTLLVSSFTAVQATILQSYPDGTVRPWDFILLDQLPLIILALTYSIVIIWPAFALTFQKPSTRQRQD